MLIYVNQCYNKSLIFIAYASVYILDAGGDWTYKKKYNEALSDLNVVERRNNVPCTQNSLYED